MLRFWGRKAENTENRDRNNRSKLILAIIFLLAFGLLARLAWLQLGQQDYYRGLANRQGNVQKDLWPTRGRIFLTDSGNVQQTPYPIAINKDFADVFVNPRQISAPEALAQTVYDYFDAAEVAAEAEAQLTAGEKEKLSKATNTEELLKQFADPIYKESRQKIKDELIKTREQELLTDYGQLFAKKTSYYASLKKKVAETSLAGFYLALARATSTDFLDATIGNVQPADLTNVSSTDLTLKDNQVWLRANDHLKKLALDGIGYQMVAYRYYPEGSMGAHLLGFASNANNVLQGNYGLEGFFNEELTGKIGQSKNNRAPNGLVIAGSLVENQPIDGSDLVLTIDKLIQFAVCQKLDEAAARHGASGGSAIVMDPYSGAIIAMCSYPDFDPNNYQAAAKLSAFNNPAIFDEYEPGSVFKAITMATALDQNKVTPQTTYFDKGQIMIKGWPKPISNSDFAKVGGHGQTNMITVLELSLNTGAIFAMQQIGGPIYADYLKNFGFGAKTGLELQGEADGNIRNLLKKKVREIDAATASFGQGLTVTPLQMIDSYAVIANGGMLVKPYIVKAIIQPDGTQTVTQPLQLRRVISTTTADTLTAMLINVVENGHSKKIKIPGYWVAGKTGTAQVANPDGKGYGGKLDHTFVGYLPATHPRFVILTKLDNPRDAIYAESTAVPLAKDIAEMIINYWQIPKERAEK